jgi:hypothetical protein
MAQTKALGHQMTFDDRAGIEQKASFQDSTLRDYTAPKGLHSSAGSNEIEKDRNSDNAVGFGRIQGSSASARHFGIRHSSVVPFESHAWSATILSGRKIHGRSASPAAGVHALG